MFVNTICFMIVIPLREFCLVYPVRVVLSTQDIFILCGDFYPASRLLSSAETFILLGGFYLA